MKRNSKSIFIIVISVFIMLITFFLPSIKSFMNEAVNDAFIERIRTEALPANIKIIQMKYNNDASGSSISVSAGASGVIIRRENNKYYALTAEHVVAESDNADKTQIIVMGYDDLDLADMLSKGGKFQGVAEYYQQFPEAVVEYSNDQYDLAVISFNSDKDYATLSIAKEKLKQGDLIASMGNPYHRRNIITVGKVSSREPRPFGRGAGKMQYPIITHTSVISGGSSGGALLSKNLEIVGINLGGNENIFRQFRSGMAIPSNLIQDFFK
jgi:S1-C subfamily serine protease